MFERQEAAVADGNTMDVGSEVFERSLPIAYRFAVHYPGFSPDGRGDSG